MTGSIVRALEMTGAALSKSKSSGVCGRRRRRSSLGRSGDREGDIEGEMGLGDEGDNKLRIRPGDDSRCHRPVRRLLKGKEMYLSKNTQLTTF